MPHLKWNVVGVVVCLALCANGQVQAPTDVKPGSITYDEVPYPYPVSYLPLTLYGQDVRMAYMDIPPAGQPNGRIVVLLHGMNFGGFYFSGPIEALRNEGFRVVVPDQIGFGRSSKPIIPYNFHDMARNTRTLLQSLGITRAAIVGHSMGGMLTARFAASYPEIAERAVIYNPIGLTDPRYQTPWRTADDAYKATMAQSHDQVYQGFYATIRRYFPTPGAWKPEYEKYVRILYAPTLGSEWPRLAMVRAIYQQITYLDPVFYDWPKIKVKTLVLGGDKDTPDFPERAKYIADTIPGAQLVLIPGAGHVPHIEVPEVFQRELLKFLKSDAPSASKTDLAPGGTLRAVFLGGNPVQGRPDPKSGEYSGVVPDLVKELAHKLGIPYKLIPAPNARGVMDAIKANNADIGFLAYDETRAREVDFSSPYALMFNTYVVRADSPIAKTGDVDRAGIKVGAVKGQSQEIYLSSTLKNARVIALPQEPADPELEKMMLNGDIDAFGENRERAESTAGHTSKLRALGDNFSFVGQALVVEKGNTAKIAALNGFVDEVIASGLVKGSLDRVKLAGVGPAPRPGR